LVQASGIVVLPAWASFGGVFVKDYYAILGLDADASSESVKLAYRRLAREVHPDRIGMHDLEAQGQASVRMADLNEAYQVLSVPQRRKEFDKEFRAWQAGEAVEAPPVSAPVPEPALPQPVRPRARPDAVIDSVVSQLSTQFLNELLSDRRVFRWREKHLEGFNWALECPFLIAKYHVALRGFATADASAAQKLINYATLAIETARSMLARNFFLFLMPFQRVSELDQVQALCRRFVGGDALDQSGARAQIVLLDTHGHGLPCGPVVDDKRYRQLLSQLGLTR
jgi:hypothetical protein